MVEDTDFNERFTGSPAPQIVAVYKPLRPGENVRRRGDDLHAGDKVLSAGTRLRPGSRATGYAWPAGDTCLPFTKSGAALQWDELLPVEASLAPGKSMMPTHIFWPPFQKCWHGTYPLGRRLRYGSRCPLAAGTSRG